MYNIEKEEFNTNLLLTQAYCEQISKGENMASVLRSYNPEYNGQPLFSFKFENHLGSSYWMTTWGIDPISSGKKYLYDELFERQLAYKKGKLLELKKEVKYKGRILVSEIDCVVRDGISEAASNGFIDINDCPPIDTWFYTITYDRRRNIFAWIPDQFVNLVDEAIDVNCLGCMKWYDSETFSLTNYSKIRGLYQKSPKEKTIFSSFIKRLFR